MHRNALMQWNILHTQIHKNKIKSFKLKEWVSGGGCVFYRFGMEVDGCYIIWSNAKCKKKNWEEKEDWKNRQSALTEWYEYYIKNALQTWTQNQIRKERKKWFNTGNLQNSLNDVDVSFACFTIVTWKKK